jgi:hypothetical protein
MRLTAGIVALASACALSACGASDRDQVRAKVEQLANAAAKHDYSALCRQVLAPSLVTRLADSGIGCVSAMQVAFGSVRHPTLSIGKININGNKAQAIALSMAQGQQASLDSIELVKTPDGWRVSSLGSPLIQR